MVRMNRKEILDVVQELLSILSEKKMTPREAETVGYIFEKNIKENNEREKERHMEEGVFSWNSPETQKSSIH